MALEVMKYSKLKEHIESLQFNRGCAGLTIKAKKAQTTYRRYAIIAL